MLPAMSSEGVCTAIKFIYIKQLTPENVLAMPISNIYAVTLISGVLSLISLGCSSYLFLQRVCAVYADSPRVRRFFSIFWLINTLSYTAILLALEPTYVAGTRYFKDSGIGPLAILTIPISVLYDSSIFLAISYKIAFMHTVVDRNVGWRTFILGKALPRLSRAVLHGGQQFYL